MGCVSGEYCWDSNEREDGHNWVAPSQNYLGETEKVDVKACVRRNHVFFL